MGIHAVVPAIPGPILGVMALLMVASLSLAFPELRQKAVARRLLVAFILAVALSAGVYCLPVSYNCHTSDWFLWLAGYCFLY